MSTDKKDIFPIRKVLRGVVYNSLVELGVVNAGGEADTVVLWQADRKIFFYDSLFSAKKQHLRPPCQRSIIEVIRRARLRFSGLTLRPAAGSLSPLRCARPSFYFSYQEVSP